MISLIERTLNDQDSDNDHAIKWELVAELYKWELVAELYIFLDTITNFKINLMQFRVSDCKYIR